MINTPLSCDADAEWAARSRGNLTSSGAGGNTPTRNVLYPFCRARTSTREMEGKVGSGVHCPGLPTVDYSTTSPGGIPTPTGRIPYPCSVASVGGFLRSQPNFRGAHSLCLYGDTGWWLASRWQPPPWLCRLLANRIRHQKQLSQFPVRVLALSALPAVSCSATHKQMKERVRT